MKKAVFFTACCLLAFTLNAQRTTNEQPFGLSTGFKAQLQEEVLVQAPDMNLMTRDEADIERWGGPVPYAVAIGVHFTSENMGVWQDLDDGSKIWRLKVYVPGALGTNTYYDKFWLPEGGKFFIYSEVTKQTIGAIISEFIAGSKESPSEYANSLIYGDKLVYEYYQPASVKEYPIISISRIDYAYRYVYNPYSIGLRNFGDALGCNININCSEGNNWQAEKHAVARVSVPLGGYSIWCSCALVNNTKNDYTPYVLTADHCFSDTLGIRYYDATGSSSEHPNASSNANLMIFFWEYEHPGCSNSITEPTPRSSIGATVVANNTLSDFGLLKLIEDPRNVAGVAPYYLGWDR